MNTASLNKKENAEFEARIKNFGIARNAILDDLKNRHKAGDKTVKPNSAWSSPYEDNEPPKSGNWFTGVGEMTCPICKTGKLRYSRSSYNGHVHARCTTINCVAWME